jgi:preprotein translocase subunit SecA
LVLKGHIVDIVTSNPFLAKRDKEESKELFTKFDISVAHNIEDEGLNFFSKTNVYSCDVVFGTTYEYQGDILRDEYKLQKIRNNRKFDVVIVDEIDCMLVDQYNHSTLLSSNIPFMDNYTVILQLLWACYKRLNLDDEQILNDNELQKKLIAFLKKNAISIINQTFKTYYLVPMCDNAREFAFAQIDNWIWNIIISLQSKKNVEYIINEEGEINPVDNKITGVICKNTVYNDGLSQYLQMKNDLPVTPISITTNYLSNFGFFRRYISNSNNIYGLTGTIGDSQTMEILKILYELDFDYIPPEKIRIIKE